MNLEFGGKTVTGRAYGAEGQKRLIERIALRRLGSPADIAHAVLFFASDQGPGSPARAVGERRRVAGDAADLSDRGRPPVHEARLRTAPGPVMPRIERERWA
jgi:NAD(P)-dependent dehydrogenase (short-subunit alcohol dehydrogenase family)